MASPTAPRAPGCQARQGRVIENTLVPKKQKGGGWVRGAAGGQSICRQKTLFQTLVGERVRSSIIL